MAGNIVRLVITADNAGALRAIRETSVAADESSKSIVASDEKTVVANREASASFESMRRGIMAVGTVALAALAFGIDKSVKAAMAWQTQQAALQTALKNTGTYSAAALKGINAQTEALATHGGFSVASQLPGSHAACHGHTQSDRGAEPECRCDKSRLGARTSTTPQRSRMLRAPRSGRVARSKSLLA